MTAPTHYFNFKPCEAVQCDDIGLSGFIGLLGGTLTDDGRNGYFTFITSDSRWLRINPGQWLIRQDGKVWVRDEEPPRVERWLLGSLIGGKWWVNGAGFEDTSTHLRPVVMVGDQEWLGPWEAVDE